MVFSRFEDEAMVGWERTRNSHLEQVAKYVAEKSNPTASSLAGPGSKNQHRKTVFRLIEGNVDQGLKPKWRVRSLFHREELWGTTE